MESIYVSPSKSVWTAMTTIEGANIGSFTASAETEDKLEKKWLIANKNKDMEKRLFQIVMVDKCGKKSKPSSVTYTGATPLYRAVNFKMTESAEEGKAQLPLTLEWNTMNSASQDGFKVYVVAEDMTKALLAELDGDAKSYTV